ncbi:hypothetical protein ACNOYE_35115 [Nannocystaceae bacterium ST9]
MTEWFVPPDQAPVLDRLLRVGLVDARARTWTLVDWAARQHWIDARYRERGGGVAVLRLYPRERSVPVEHRRTERFTLAALRGGGPALLDALAEHVGRHEHAFVWRRANPSSPAPPPVQSPAIVDPRELDSERTAFELGLKPALRLLFDPQDMPWAAALLVREGAAVAGVLAGLPGGHAVLMAAHSLADAEAMLAAEFVQLGSDHARGHAGARELGRRLGYPSCCVEAFVANVERCRRSRSDHNWGRLDAGWCARPNPRINSLLFGELLRLISFDPCRFDCPSAGAIADALFDRLAIDAPIACAALDRQLARPVLVDDHDRRAWIELAPDERGRPCIRALEPIRLGNDTPLDREALFALIGQRVDEQGRLPDLPGAHQRVFRFDLG